MTTDAAGEPTRSASAGQAGQARKLSRRLTRWWSQTPDGRTYQRRQADALVAAAGLGVVVVCGVLVANRTVMDTDVAIFRWINHWPGWLYPLMWTVQLPGVIGALYSACSAHDVWSMILGLGVGIVILALLSSGRWAWGTARRAAALFEEVDRDAELQTTAPSARR